MARVALSLALMFLGAMATALPTVVFDETITITIPGIPKTTFKGVTFSADHNITNIIVDPAFSHDFTTTNKYVEIDNKAVSLVINHYTTSGTVAGLDLTGDGRITLSLSDHIINKLSYTSTSADSFCAVPGSVKVFFQTHKANLKITGMKDSTVEQLAEGFVNSNQATLGTTIGNLINENFGAEINKYVVPIINSVCKL